MKKVALISTFCDTKEKEKILLSNIKSLKENGVDIICIGPNFIPIDYEVIRNSDHFLFTKENPVLEWPDRACSHWKEIFFGEGKKLRLTHYTIDYGWAALYHIKKMLQVALGYDYNLFYPMVYDLEIDESVLKEITSDVTNSFYTRLNPKNPSEKWESTLHFLVFDRDTAKKIETQISLENYLEDEGFAEEEVLKWSRKFGITQRPISVRDKIFYFEGLDFFDLRISEDFKIFLTKDGGLSQGIFYNVKRDFIPIRILVNGREETHILRGDTIVDLNRKGETINTIKIFYGENFFDLSEQYKKISRNYFEKK